MGASRKALIIASLLMASTMSSGCLALSIQREIMESWREPPVYIDEDGTVGWAETFETGTELDSVLYQNETNLVFDETVSSLVINFRAQFPYSSTVEDLVGNDTNQVRYVEARGWGVTTPVEQLSFHDSFDLYATMTKPCVHFPSSHEVTADGEMECTFLSELED